MGSQRRCQASRQVTLRVVPDTNDEPDERFTLTLAYDGPSLPHLQGGDAIATLTISDDDHVPVFVGWEPGEWAVAEQDAEVTLKVAAATATDKMPEEGFDFSISVFTSASRAGQPDDYDGLSEVATFSLPTSGRIRQRRGTTARPTSCPSWDPRVWSAG